MPYLLLWLLVVIAPILTAATALTTHGTMVHDSSFDHGLANQSAGILDRFLSRL